ncbi:hypothetical protein MMC20_007298 [Loxospora ochrophaea]|nr:hypothetical protein [Loxospora ochrophaea]
MAASPAPPQAATPQPTMRRAFTLPPKLADSQSPRSSPREAESQGVETLFAHSMSKIVSFSPAQSLSRSSPIARHRKGDVEKEPVGILPWASLTERTLAAGIYFVLKGPLRIYRLGSVAFLDSGSTLHPILAKSQCWCVDGETKFVLRIRSNNYYRIELPNSSSWDKEKAEELKLVLAKVLQYELTPCPFKRGFTVDLPEPPSTPVRKRPWKPQERPKSMLEEKTNESSTTSEKIKKTESESSSAESTDDDRSSDVTEDSVQTPREAQDSSPSFWDPLKTPTRPVPMNTSRSVTAPQLTLKTSSPSKFPPSLQGAPIPENDTASLSSSIDSFHSIHSFHSPISPLPPSPPYSDPPSPPLSQSPTKDPTISVSRIRQNHQRDLSEITVTGNESSSLWDLSTPTQPKPQPQLSQPSTSPVSPETPALTNSTSSSQSDDTWSSALSLPSPPSLHRRTHSPLPSSANLYTPRTDMGHHLTTAILQKTCSFLMGPPAQLVALMLNIAAKIARGALRGSSFGYGSSGQKIPCSWDYSDAEEEGEGADDDDEWDEDDYGISLRPIPSKERRRRSEMEGSWEID